MYIIKVKVADNTWTVAKDIKDGKMKPIRFKTKKEAQAHTKKWENANTEVEIVKE
jgi:hypothetical protein